MESFRPLLEGHAVSTISTKYDDHNLLQTIFKLKDQSQNCWVWLIFNNFYKNCSQKKHHFVIFSTRQLIEKNFNLVIILHLIQQSWELYDYEK